MLARIECSRAKSRTILTFHHATLLDEMNSVAGDALETERKSCSEEVLKFKDIKGRIKNIFEITSKTFNTICQKLKMKFKASKLRVEKKWKF